MFKSWGSMFKSVCLSQDVDSLSSEEFMCRNMGKTGEILGED